MVAPAGGKLDGWVLGAVEEAATGRTCKVVAPLSFDVIEG